MKPLVLVPPVLAIIVSALWLASQRHTLSEITADSVRLKTATEAVIIAAHEEKTHFKTGPDGGKHVTNWQELGSTLTSGKIGDPMSDRRALDRFKELLAAMNAAELTVALDDVAKQGLPESAQRDLESRILDFLIRLDPETALTRLFARPDSSSLNQQVCIAFCEWARKNPAKASAWFDAKNASGAFGGKNSDREKMRRNYYGAALMTGLLTSDPASVKTRLGALSQDERIRAFESMPSIELKEEDYALLGQLLREQIPDQKDKSSVLVSHAGRIGNLGDYQKVTNFLNFVQARPEEKAAAILPATGYLIRKNCRFKKITTADIESLRTWVATQAPAMTDPATGAAIARAFDSSIERMTLDEVAGLVMQYNEIGSDDQVLLTFLSETNPAMQEMWKSEKTARYFTSKIADHERREIITSYFK